MFKKEDTDEMHGSSLILFQHAGHDLYFIGRFLVDTVRFPGVSCIEFGSVFGSCSIGQLGK